MFISVAMAMYHVSTMLEEYVLLAEGSATPNFSDEISKSLDFMRISVFLRRFQDFQKIP